MNSGCFGKRRFGKNMAADVSAKKICRNVSNFFLPKRLCRNVLFPPEWLPVTWLNTILLNFFVESFDFKILSQVTTKLSQLHSNSRNKYVNSGKYHNVGHMRCMHARPHRRKDQLPQRSLRDLRSR